MNRYKQHRCWNIEAKCPHCLEKWVYETEITFDSSHMDGDTLFDNRLSEVTCYKCGKYFYFSKLAYVEVEAFLSFKKKKDHKTGNGVEQHAIR